MCDDARTYKLQICKKLSPQVLTVTWWSLSDNTCRALRKDILYDLGESATQLRQHLLPSLFPLSSLYTVSSSARR